MGSSELGPIYRRTAPSVTASGGPRQRPRAASARGKAGRPPHIDMVMVFTTNLFDIWANNG